MITVISAFLPDLDSDTGIPLKILLTTLSFIGGGIIGWILFKVDNFSLTHLILYTLSFILFIYYGVGGLIKKMTHHRGIFHSIPSVFLSILLTLTFLNYFSITNSLKFVLSLSVGIGYLSHLILDEMNSIVNLEGIPFIPKKSLGTALKLYSSRWVITLLIYSIIIFLFVHNWTIIYNFYQISLKAIS
jgi:membrane-bound metal-dependent hydrolase YbcI (DUF457 family)